MDDAYRQLGGLRTLIVGASSGIGRALALVAHACGARVALAARRMELITPLATQLSGSAHDLDVSNPSVIATVVRDAAAALGGIDAVVFTSAAITLAQVDEVDASTWAHAFAVNAIGPSLVMRAALPYLSDAAVIVVTSSATVGNPGAGTAAYTASKAALDEILRSWRWEHPELRIIRVAVGPTDNTELLRGTDPDLLAEFREAWARHGQIPEQMSTAEDVATIMVALIAAARRSPSVVTEVVELAPRISRNNGLH